MDTEMPKKSDGKRDQFSITMSKDVKEHLETLASLKKTSLSLLIEDLGKREIETIDDDTWNEIQRIMRIVQEAEEDRPKPRRLVARQR